MAARLGQRVRARRLALGWSQAALAERLTTSVEYVSMLERGTRLPSLPTFVALGDALALSLDALVAGQAEGSPEPDVLEAAARAVPAAVRPLVARMLVAIADPGERAPRVGKQPARPR